MFGFEGKDKSDSQSNDGVDLADHFMMFISFTVLGFLYIYYRGGDIVYDHWRLIIILMGILQLIILAFDFVLYLCVEKIKSPVFQIVSIIFISCIGITVLVGIWNLPKLDAYNNLFISEDSGFAEEVKSYKKRNPWASDEMANAVVSTYVTADCLDACTPILGDISCGKMCQTNEFLESPKCYSLCMKDALDNKISEEDRLTVCNNRCE